MKTQKYQLPEETLMDYIVFKRAINQISEQLPLNPSSIIEIAQEELKNDKNGDIDGYHRYLAFIDLYVILDDHLDLFYPSEQSQSRIRQMIKVTGPMGGIPGDIPQAMSFSGDNLLENINWVTRDTIRELFEYDFIELDITTVFWDKVLEAHDHEIYNLPWIKDNEDLMISEIGLDSIRDFMEEITNPDWDEPRKLEEVRKFIYNVI